MGTTDSTVGAGTHDFLGNSRPYVMYNTVSWSGIATGEVVQCLSIPAGTYVVNVVCKVVAATGVVSTATVGDGAGADSWDASTNLNAAAGTYTVGAGGTDAYVTAGKLYSSADTIDLTVTMASTPTAGSMKVMAICFDCS